MKVLQINATYGIGSTGRVTKLLHEKLKEFGHESFVVTTVVENDVKIDDNIFIPCGKFSIKLSALHARVFGNQNNIASASTRKIIKFIERIQPDVIQLANIHANFVNLSLLLNYIADKNIPLVVVLHDCWFFTGKCTNYIDENCFGWKKNCGNCPKLKKDIPSWTFDKTGTMLCEKKALFDKVKNLTVVGVSEKITEDARCSNVFGGRNCTCIPNPIDDTIFYADNKISCCAKGPCRIISAASEWSEYKGINEFVTLGEICKNRFGDRVQISLAGSLDKISFATRKRLEDAGINLLGTLSTDTLADEYRSSDVFVSLSKGESYGLSISEAMACDLAVISREGYAEGDIVRKYNRGYVVGNDNCYEQIVNCIAKIAFCEDSGHTKSGVLEACEPQSVAEYAKKFLTVYERF
ncbi:MAG: glycosyltransferase [Ruminococcaceae bacterium]|nr:glycosyltransferase [Oscillospiraceae bacterium]